MMAEKMVLATSNQGKIDEFRLLLDFPGWQWVPQGEYQVEDAEETGTTFKANALLKARHAQSQVGLAALADDSGLEVEALGVRQVYFLRGTQVCTVIIRPILTS